MHLHLTKIQPHLYQSIVIQIQFYYLNINLLLHQPLQSSKIFYFSQQQILQALQNMLLNNGHYPMVFQTLQSDLAQLENHFLKFKLIVNQSSLNQSHQQSPFNIHLENIKSTFVRFCTRIQSEIAEIQSKLISLSSRSVPSPKINLIQQDQKYDIVYERICVLQQKLRQTQKNQSKLIEAISILMRKYQISQQPTMIQNDENLLRKIKISQVTSAANEKNCGFGGNRNLQSSSSSRENLNRTLKKNEANIYLFNDRDNDRSKEKKYLYDSKQFLRTFSNPSQNLKISLKQISNPNYTSRNPLQMMTRQIGKNDYRASSLDLHQHRLQFMMNKLHE